MILLKPTNQLLNLDAPDIIQSELGTVTISESTVIFEANPDVLISFRTGFTLLMRIVTKVGARSVVYISNRINDYAVDPTDYKYLEMIPNLKGIAVVRSSTKVQNSINLEKHFFKKPFRLFSTITEAKSWAEVLLADQPIESL